ncbi:hypothetical protein DUZ99_01685 [Xylanibacillus composti]|nr:hypothetical protein [Xylanibacillus composti]
MVLNLSPFIFLLTGQDIHQQMTRYVKIFLQVLQSSSLVQRNSWNKIMTMLLEVYCLMATLVMDLKFLWIHGGSVSCLAMWGAIVTIYAFEHVNNKDLLASFTIQSYHSSSPS